MRSSREKINAIVLKDKMYKRRIVFLDTMGNFLESVEDPRDWIIIYRRDGKRFEMDGQAFKALWFGDRGKHE